jgi:ABC-type Mn2+/Zn2+ transport system ATPase subunit
MEVKIYGIGPIEKATIKVNGLTILAGLNDSGKSTIGKLLFALTKAISRYEEDLRENRAEKITRIVENIYFRLRRYMINLSFPIEIRELFLPPYFIRDLKVKKEGAIEKRIKYIRHYIKEPEIREEFLQMLNEIKRNFFETTEKSTEEIVKEALNRVFISEFENELVRKIGKKGKIYIKDDLNELLTIEVDYEKNRYSISLKGNLTNLQSIFFRDATLIETPIILNYQEAVANAKSYFEIRNKIDRLRRLGEPNIQFHTRDLDLKLRQKIYEEDVRRRKIEKKIEKIIKGRILYDHQQEDFIFQKKDNKIKIINTASGIKSFGIIQMLLKAGFLDERTLLIIDEPEVHLHPIWQLKYAELIVNLVKEIGVTAIVTSHNPYIVDALNLYSQLYNIEKLTTFYLVDKGVAEETEVGAIFKSLGDPIEQLRELRYQIKSSKLRKKE